MKNFKGLLAVIAIMLVFLVGCSPTPAVTFSEATEAPVSTQVSEDSGIAGVDYPAPTDVPMPIPQSYPEPEEGASQPEAQPETDASADYPAAAPEAGDTAGYPAPDTGSGTCEPLPAEPQTQTFFSDDDVLLSGTFYPAAACNAPLILLFHQYGSSSEQWTNLALWLQNRADERSSVPRGQRAAPARQYAWFPQMPDGLTFNVFALDFRGHGRSNSSGSDFDGPGYITDANNALAFAKSLPFVDQAKVITIGTSIGADASAAACLAVENGTVVDFQVNKGCVGVLSLSPGNYLGVNYVAMVTRLSETPFSVHVHCVASEQDGDSPRVCNTEVPGNFVRTVYPGRGDHGIALFRENLDPDIGDLVLEFLLKSITIQ